MVGRILVFAVVAQACAGAVAEPAKAAAWQEWQLGFSAGGGVAFGLHDAVPGASAGADLQYGVSDAWAWRLALEGGAHAAVTSKGDPVGRGLATFGGTYTLDVLRWLPFAEMGLCAGWLGPSASSRIDLGAQLGVGADYLIDRRWAVAPVLRYAALPVNVSGGSDGQGPLQILTLLVRVSYRFE